MHLYASNNYMNGGYVDYTSSITPKLNKPPPQSSGGKYPQYVQDVYSYLDKQVMGGGDNDAKMIPPPPVSGRNNNSTIIADLTKKLEDFQQRNMYFMFFIVVLIFYIIFKPDGLGHYGNPPGYYGGHMPHIMMPAQPVYTMPVMQPMMTAQPMMPIPQPTQK
jgi:hypothetical protein